MKNIYFLRNSFFIHLSKFKIYVNEPLLYLYAKCEVKSIKIFLSDNKSLCAILNSISFF